MDHPTPSAPSFDLNAPLPGLKQRRVSLGLPSDAPRLLWSFRDDTGIAGPSNQQSPEHAPLLPQQETEPKPKVTKRTKTRKNMSKGDGPVPEKKPRKKWTAAETQMLVEGCNRHGVGNWKTILNDTTLKFDNRSPVDLKDRFRTYFPDAYQKHYPNAKTHLSNKVRATLPDGTSIFEKTRSKRRRPFTEEEDRALKAGYEKHGTIWATIVKDPIFQEHNRRSTDLRDRFRNAYPDLYQAAGYKPRNNTKKKKDSGIGEIEDAAKTTTESALASVPTTTPTPVPGRAVTDDHLILSSQGAGVTGPIRGTRRRRAYTTQGLLLRGGVKSVPQSTACSEDEDSSGAENDDADMNSSARTTLSKTRVPIDAMSTITTTTTTSTSTVNGGDGNGGDTSKDPFPRAGHDEDMRLISLQPLVNTLSEFAASVGLQNTGRQGSSQSDANANHSSISNAARHLWSSSHTSSNPQVQTHDDGGRANNAGGKTSTNHTHSSESDPVNNPARDANESNKAEQPTWSAEDWLSSDPQLEHSAATPLGHPASASKNNSANTGSHNGINCSNVNTNTNVESSTGPGTPSSYFSPPSPFSSFNLTPLHTTHPLTPATSTSASAPHNSSQNPSQSNGNASFTNFNLPLGLGLGLGLGGQPYSSHQHQGVIERYDLWSSSALNSFASSTSGFSHANNGPSASVSSSGWSGFSGGEFPGSGPGSVSGWDGELSSDVSFSEADMEAEPEGSMLGATAYAGTGTLRAITHHSDYAGDLIFGARGYGLGGGFAWFGTAYAPTAGPANEDPGGNENDDGGNGSRNATGLSLVGEAKDDRNGERRGTKDSVDGGTNRNADRMDESDGTGGINPMQLHTPSGSLSGIDEIELAGITLNDSQDVDDAMEGTEQTTSGMYGNPRNGLGLDFSMSPSQRQQLQRVQSESVSQSKGSNSMSPASANSSPDNRRAFHLIHPHLHSHSSPMSPIPSQVQLGNNGSGHHASNILPSFTFNRSSANVNASFGRFSLDDLDLVDPYQDITMAMSNLTPPATPMMHAQQMKGLRRYSAFGAGNTTGQGIGMVGGSSTFNQGQSQQHAQVGGGGQAGRSVSVPPSEARNSMSIPVSMSMSERNGERGSVGADFGGNEGRSNPAADDMVIAAPGGVTVKRSLSSTINHSHGSGHGHEHSHSISALPPLPSHSEIWRTKTPTAGTSSNTNIKCLGTPPTTANKGIATPNPSNNASPSIFNNCNANPFATFNPTGELMNPDLSFLDLHYYSGSGNVQGFNSMVVDGAHHATASANLGMTLAELEARQALDLAQPFYTHGQGQSMSNLQQALNAFGNANPNGGGAVKEMQSTISPLVLSRHASQNPRDRGHGQQQMHQKGQSQGYGVVNPRDLFLNAGNTAGGSEKGTGGVEENKRKRVSWDGGVV